MNTLKSCLSKVDRVWRVILLTAFLVGLLAPPVTTAHAVAHKVGLVTDGGVSDMSFNYSAYQGLLQAQTDMGISPTLYETTGSSEYATALQKCVDDGNELCFAVGYSMGAATAVVAAANPSTDFAVLDMSPSSPPSNLRGIIFNEKQAGYLAGALAGKLTGSVVGVIGGTDIPSVRSYVEGFQNGAQCATATDVEVLTQYAGTFSDPDLGAGIAADMMSRGATVIFAAAGPTGNGAILYSSQHDVWSIGVDTDQYLSLFGNGSVLGSDILLTSAVKRLDRAVYNTIYDELHGTFTSGTVTYDLAHDGVGLAPYHETDSVISASVKDYVEDVKDGILDGSIDINYACRPRFHAEIVENDVMGYDWLPGLSVTMTINDPDNGPSVDFADTQTVNSTGDVVFQNLGSLVLEPDMVVIMVGGSITKTHTVTDLTVLGVDPDLDTVWGTGPVGVNMSVQHCDEVGCSWRRWAIIQPDSTWQVDFSVSAGPTEPPEEQNILDIVPGMQGEALQSDVDGDHTDYQWSVPNPVISGSTVAGATLSYTGDTSGSTEADASGAYSISVPYGWDGAVTPSFAGCSFSPTHQTYSNVTADITGEDYTATCSLTFKSVAANDGWVLESGENTNAGGSMDSAATTFKLGDDAANKQYRGILSFNTSTLPDNALIDSVKLRIKKSGVVGADPFSSLGKIAVDIKKGSFSNSPALQKGDFQAAANLNNAALILNTLVSGWYNRFLPSGSFGFVNLLGTTQFRLRFETDDNNNHVANDLLIFSGNAAASSRPQLVITYHAP